MYLLYLDESGVRQHQPPATTSHYVLTGLAVRDDRWEFLDRQVQALTSRYSLPRTAHRFELHAGWLNRSYEEQHDIPNFDQISAEERYEAVQRLRAVKEGTRWTHLNAERRRAKRKLFELTEPYVHLTRAERNQLLLDVLALVRDAGSGVLLIGSAIDKTTLPRGTDPADEAFTQIVVRFEAFLRQQRRCHRGLVMMDHDVQAARLLPAMLRRFQCEGVRAARIRRVIEAPFFTDSKTSNGVQVTDVCAYVVRRYLELFEAHRLTPHDEQRFAAIYRRFVRTDDGSLAGLHHLSVPTCTCLICSDSHALGFCKSAAPSVQPNSMAPKR